MCLESLPPFTVSRSLSELGPWGLLWMLKLCPGLSFPGDCLGNPLALASVVGRGKTAVCSAPRHASGSIPQKASPTAQRAGNHLTCRVELIRHWPLGKEVWPHSCPSHPGFQTQLRRQVLFQLGSWSPRTADKYIPGFPTFFLCPFHWKVFTPRV